MSVVTVLEKVLQIDDPEGEMNRMFADKANLDPVIVLMRIAQALRDEGEEELAARIEEQQFQVAFAQDMQRRQMMGGADGGMGGGQGGDQAAMMGARTGNPAATGAITGRPGQGQPAEPSGAVSGMPTS